jgi:hypothetical protein
MRHVKTFEDLHIKNVGNEPKPEIGHLPQGNQDNQRTITSSELWRDKNKELKQLLDTVANSYTISRESASKALAQYFSSEHWKAGEK